MQVPPSAIYSPPATQSLTACSTLPSKLHYSGIEFCKAGCKVLLHFPASTEAQGCSWAWQSTLNVGANGNYRHTTHMRIGYIRSIGIFPFILIWHLLRKKSRTNKEYSLPVLPYGNHKVTRDGTTVTDKKGSNWSLGQHRFCPRPFNSPMVPTRRMEETHMLPRII